jgi:hypothetical protein
MAGKRLFLALLVILNANGVYIHILSFTLLSVDWFNLLLEIKQSLVIFSETGVHVACQSMAITCVSGAVVALFTLFLLFALIDKVKWLFR